VHLLTLCMVWSCLGLQYVLKSSRNQPFHLVWKIAQAAINKRAIIILYVWFFVTLVYFNHIGTSSLPMKCHKFRPIFTSFSSSGYVLTFAIVLRFVFSSGFMRLITVLYLCPFIWKTCVSDFKIQITGRWSNIYHCCVFRCVSYKQK
jgi:hypothetical protein